jgi:hypothetical protein
LWRLTAHKIAEIFGARLRRRLPAKLAAVIDRIEHCHHVFRALHQVRKSCILAPRCAKGTNHGHSVRRHFFSKFRNLCVDSASVVVPIISELAPIKSVCDVGCGIGTWLGVWKDYGIEDLCGIDGGYIDRAKLMFDPADFLPRDLTKRICADRQYDLAMSMEVVEHLPPERGPSFVEDLTNLAPLVLFLAAIPMQGGTDHINEQWQEFCGSGQRIS